MIAFSCRRIFAAVALVFVSVICLAARAEDGTVLTFDQPKTAGISGFRVMWDTPIVLSATGATRVNDKGSFGGGQIAIWNVMQRGMEGGDPAPGALVFDAVHRSMLVRFPDVAEKVAAELDRGMEVAKVELVLPFKGYEFFPENYSEPAGMSFQGDRWVKNPPHWHAVASALRRPWTSDAKIGPTYNAAINGVMYWTKFGAQDTQSDRYPQSFTGLVPSKYQPFRGSDKKQQTADELLTGVVEKVKPEDLEGRLDVTPVLLDAQYGSTPQARLRGLADCGFIVRKLETYDARYMTGGYEYGTQTGPRGILVDTPRLVITLKQGAAPKPNNPPMPAAFDFKDPPKAVAEGKRGVPTAVMPNASQITAFAKARGVHRPDWMPAWQWDRVSELRNAGKAQDFPATPDAFAKWIDPMLAMAPRRFDGFDGVEKLQEYLMYSDTWPEPVREHWKNYWTAWLMPDRKTKELVHPWNQAKDIVEYYAKTGDWRGNTNFYRPYSRNMGTMNFNHTAVSGALLGGSIINSPESMADGRYGLDRFLLRTWSWLDGSTQESLDHYYFAVTLKAQKAFADFGPTPMDRMLGKNILAKSVEELASAYHPGLRRFIATSNRTGIGYLLGIQDGTKHIVHTLSRKGAITDLGKSETVGGMPVYGHDALPGTIATQTLNGPWADEWLASIVDEKPLPFEMTVTYKMWGGFAATPIMRRSYMGKNYGMASQDVACKDESVPVMAQWRRTDKTAENASDIGTLLCRFGINKTNLLDTVHRFRKGDGSWSQNPNGVLGTQGGYTSTLQHKNKMVVMTSPLKNLAFPGYSVPVEVASLQTTIGLLNFQASPTWELYLNGERVTKLPVNARAEDRITIKDGVSFIAVIPLPSSDLGRTAEVVITDDTGDFVPMQGGGKVRPALLIQQFNFLSDTPLSPPIEIPIAPDLAATAAIKTNEEPTETVAHVTPVFRIPLMTRERRGSEEVDDAFGGFVIEMADAAEYKDFAAFQSHIDGGKVSAEWNPGEKVVDVKYTVDSEKIELGYKPEYNGGPTDQCFTYRKVNGKSPYPAKGIDRDSTLTQQGTTGKLEKNGATLICEAGKMAYLQTEPISGTVAGFNPFPDAVADWSLTLPGGASVKADGRVGLLKVVVQPKENRVLVDYAAGDSKDEGMAKALIITGMNMEPAVVLNGKAVKAQADEKGAWKVGLE